jgi:hypothetical protein
LILSFFLQTGHSLIFFLQELQSKWPLSHWEIGPPFGTSRQTGHSSMDAKFSMEDIFCNKSIDALTNFLFIGLPKSIQLNCELPFAGCIWYQRQKGFYR